MNNLIFATTRMAPLVYLMKKVVVDGRIDQLSLYGFSAGGACVTNVLAVLNDPRYDEALLRYGIKPDHKKNIIKALQKGLIIIECPLKSCEEIMSVKGKSLRLTVASERCKENGLCPIESINRWPQSGLNVIAYFQDPDDAVVNRDDNLFLERIEKVNKNGNTVTIIADDGGHIAYHKSLWDAFPEFTKSVNNELSD